jgi:methionine-rich copper-binding protein CopC
MAPKPVLLLALVVSAFTSTALAHAIVVSSSPKSGETGVAPDLTIEVRFNSRIDGKRSRLLLVRPDGVSVPLTLLSESSDDRLSAKAHDLAPGDYRLHWQTLSVDGHLTQGDVPFRVGP